MYNDESNKKEWKKVKWLTVASQLKQQLLTVKMCHKHIKFTVETNKNINFDTHTHTEKAKALKGSYEIKANGRGKLLFGFIL